MGGAADCLDEEKGLLFLDIRLVKAIEYHESMIPDLEEAMEAAEVLGTEDTDGIEGERIYHQSRIEWLKELLKLRNRVERQDETIRGYQEEQEEGREEAGGVTKGALRRLHKRLAEAEAKLKRSEEVLDSAQRQNGNLITQNMKLRDEKAALADVIADLKMDLKARE